MIFCYIANTPCLVFQNNNHKVQGCYEWIKDNSKINLINEYNEGEIIAFFDEKKSQ